MASCYADSLAVIERLRPESTWSSWTAALSANLNGAYSVHIDGSYAYVASWYADSLTVIDISDPNNLVELDSHTSANLNGARSVHIDGSYAYVASGNAGSLTAIDISDPANLTELGSHTSTNLNGARSVHIDGTYAYVASDDADSHRHRHEIPRQPDRPDSTANVVTNASIQGMLEVPKIQSGQNLLLQPNSGNVGIGVANPQSKLDVLGGLNVADRLVASTISNSTFEASFDDWVNAAGDDQDWTRNSGTTTSSGTGPSSGADGTSWYVYYETSDPVAQDDQAILDYASNIDTSLYPDGFDISFYYHMYGASMGELRLETSEDGGLWEEQWSMSGDQGDEWFEETVDLSELSGVVDIRFVGIRGSSFTGDMALDEIEIHELNMSSLLHVNNLTGYVGIGTASADTTLEVQGGLCVSDDSADDCSTAAGTIRADGSITANAFDIAELYGATEMIEPGTIVSADTNHSRYTTVADGSAPLMGVVSTDPGFVLGWKDNPDLADAPHSVEVALAGRVPVKVTTENGNIKAGDPITISLEHPGVGRKATSATRIIGYALEDYTNTDPTEIGTIELFMQPETYLPGIQDTDVSDLQGNALSVPMLNVSGPAVISNLTVTGNATVQGNLTVENNLTVKTATVTSNLTVGGRILSHTTETPAIELGGVLQGDKGSVDLEGTDMAGTITFTTNEGVEIEKGILAKVLFAESVDDAIPRVNLMPVGAGSTGLDLYIERTADGFKVGSNTPLEPNKTYRFDYITITTTN
ncbi:MAG: hypothetical protein U5K77_00955 [Candidatus Saccharibacteria bacterium]|nr:hypothetical protein [Candidatus Saccharibacteria bacterium]